MLIVNKMAAMKMINWNFVLTPEGQTNGAIEEYYSIKFTFTCSVMASVTLTFGHSLPQDLYTSQ